MLFRKSKVAPPAKAEDVMVALTFKEVLAHSKLEHHARHLAIKGEPAQHHPGLTLPESDTVDYIEWRNAARTADFQAQLAALLQQLNLLGPNVAHDPAVVQQRCLDGVAGIIGARVPIIQQSLADEQIRRAELHAWRDDNYVARPAEYPASRLVHFQWVLALLGLETAALATSLLQATPDGLVGAIGLALGISATTTGLGLLIGFGALRYMAAPSAVKKLAAWLALPVLGLVLLLVAAYAAHFRHVAGAAIDTPTEAQVMEHLASQPFDLSGQGILLFMLSLACAGFAAWKGYTSSDPIPGYEKIDRSFVKARDDVAYLRRDIQGAIAAVKASTAAPLMDQTRIARFKTDHLKTLLGELESRRERIANLAQQEAALAERAIKHFRRVNLATRADGVTPAYFSEAVVVATDVPALPPGLAERIDAASVAAIAGATKATELAVQVARALDRTSEGVDDIMAAVERARLPQGSNPAVALRSTLEARLAAKPELPPPAGQDAIAAPAATI